MQQPYKGRGAIGRMASPFPFSSYIVKSYSSDSPEKKTESRPKLQQA